MAPRGRAAQPSRDTRKIKDCKSCFRCRQSQRKHHTTICQQKGRTLLNPEATPFHYDAENLQNNAVLHSRRSPLHKSTSKDHHHKRQLVRLHSRSTHIVDEGTQSILFRQLCNVLCDIVGETSKSSNKRVKKRRPKLLLNISIELV